MWIYLQTIGTSNSNFQSDVDCQGNNYDVVVLTFELFSWGLMLGI